MRNYYPIEVEFYDDPFNPTKKDDRKHLDKIFKSVLITDNNDIELRLYHKEDSFLNPIHFEIWARTIEWNKFGSSLKIKLIKREEHRRLKRIELKDSKLLSFSSNYSHNESYIVLKLDQVTFYTEPVKSLNNKAEFYFNDRGFRVVEQFYSYLSHTNISLNDGMFHIPRVIDIPKNYKLGKSTYVPEFQFFPNDKRESREANIKKVPILRFNYKVDINEEEAILYGDIMLLVVSFYFNINIDFKLRKIYLPDVTVSIKKVEQKVSYDTKGNLWNQGVYKTFEIFLKSINHDYTIKNFNLLSKAIYLLNQSHMVSSTSKFLIRYNIIEICDKLNQNSSKFKFLLNKKSRGLKQNEALKILLDTIDPDEHEEFIKRWKSIMPNLERKPMKNQLVSFLESQNIDPTTFPISVKRLQILRNNITHGSIDKIDNELLRDANYLLYKVCGVLILNLIGINDWHFNPITK